MSPFSASELAWMSAGDLAREIRERRLSAVELMEATIARIEARDPSLQAFTFRAFDEARRAAAAADAALAAGEEVGPLHGVPTAIKDLFDFKPGWPATMGGIRRLHDHSLDFTCVWAERMEAAGAIVVGKTNSPIMGFRATCDNPLFGPSRNPFDVERNTGGSSGGAGAAVADGLLSFAEGTDGGGSVRIPASACNLFGFKQSWGRVPTINRPNAFSLMNPFCFEGVLTRTVADAALWLTLISGPDPRDPLCFPFDDDPIGALERPLRGTRIAWAPTLGGFAVEPEVLAVCAEAVAALAEAGAEIEEVDIAWPASQRELSDLWCRLITPLNLEGLALLKEAGHDLLGEHREELPPQYLRWMDQGLTATAPEISRDQALRTACFDAIQAVFAGHDLLVSPVLGALPPVNAPVKGETFGPSEVAGVAVDESIGWTLTFPFNYSGHPAASVPAGLAHERLPVGLQVVGPLRGDADVLAACAALERIRPWQDAYALCEARPIP
jgi:amidase/aspartyl-tRNA(Asn)/glutamyl-tRNA(Gln) amidotransferase subunit A